MYFCSSVRRTRTQPPKQILLIQKNRLRESEAKKASPHASAAFYTKTPPTQNQATKASNYPPIAPHFTPPHLHSIHVHVLKCCVLRSLRRLLPFSLFFGASSVLTFHPRITDACATGHLGCASLGFSQPDRANDSHLHQREPCPGSVMSTTSNLSSLPQQPPSLSGSGHYSKI